MSIPLSLIHSVLGPLLPALRFAVSLVLAGSLLAAPYGPQGLATEFTQPDGTRLKLVVFGDEFGARTETEDGYTVVFDPARKAYFYATVATDGSSLIPAEAAPVRGKPKNRGLAKHLDVAPEAAAASAKARAKRWAAETRIHSKWGQLKERRAAPEAPQPTPGQESTAAAQASASPGSGVIGNKVGLTLLIDFADDPATIPQASIIDFCNGDNYTGFGNNGSVKEYFKDTSNNLLVYTNVVTAYVSANWISVLLFLKRDRRA